MVVVNCEDCSVGKCRHRICCKYSNTCADCKKHGKWKEEEKKDDKKGGGKK